MSLNPLNGQCNTQQWNLKWMLAKLSNNGSCTKRYSDWHKIYSTHQLTRKAMCVYRNGVARSRNRCCSRKAIIITYSECVFVALVIQHAKAQAPYYTAWLKNMDSISYVCISWTIHGTWVIYITFETGGPKFSNTTRRALAERTAVQERQLRAKWLLCSTRFFACAA
jgi:hypothetical protein